MERSLPSTRPSSSRRTEDLVHEVNPERRLRAPSWPTSPPPPSPKLRRTRAARHESPSERRGDSSSGAALAAALPCSSPRGDVPGNIAQPLRPITLPRAWPQAAQHPHNQVVLLGGLRGRSIPVHECCGVCGLPCPGDPDIPLVQLSEHPRGVVRVLLGVVPLHRKTLPRRHFPPRHDPRHLTMLPDSHVVRGRFRGSSRLVSH